jgi:hypothetical protein
LPQGQHQFRNGVCVHAPILAEKAPVSEIAADVSRHHLQPLFSAGCKPC